MDPAAARMPASASDVKPPPVKNLVGNVHVGLHRQVGEGATCLCCFKSSVILIKQSLKLGKREQA